VGGSILAVGMMISMREQHFDVEFIVPNGFHGVFVIMDNRIHGTADLLLKT
jgi:hypothetical protein